ncbi:MAG: ABC transporter ATP-binding protein [Candidatus Caldatribacteriaceae bacterium]
MGGHFQVDSAKPQNPLKTMERLWRYLRESRLQIVLVLLCVGFSSFLMLLGPYLIGKAIDDYIIPKNLRGLSLCGVLMVSLYLVTSFLFWLQEYLVIRVIQRAVVKFRKDAFDALHLLPLRFFDTHPRGDIMSRLTNDIDTIGNALSTTLTQIFSGIVILSGTIVMMLRQSKELTLVSMTVIPLVILVTRFVAQRTKESFFTQQAILGRANSILEENITGLRVVRAFLQEKKERERFDKANEELKAAGIRAQIYAGVMGPLMNVLNNSSLALIAGFGGWFATRGTVSVGTIASFIAYSRQFIRPLNELANQFNMLQSAIASAERVLHIMDEPPEPPDPREALELKRVRGEVEFCHVSFSYKEGVPVLKDVSFHAKPGQMVAIVGPTGAGKTTIVNLLARFYEPDEGVILIDGIDIRKVKKESLRSLLGVVLQDTYLFSTSVRENIRYGRPEASNREVEEAARLANAEHLILGLPRGYDTILTDGGENLSQGQRQLLAIARAFLSNPSILILDEATSNVDTRTEQHIQSAMLRLMRGRTSFIIAHRLSTICRADLILVVKDGKVIEQGTHEELLEKKGFYYDLYMSQFEGQKRSPSLTETPSL